MNIGRHPQYRVELTSEAAAQFNGYTTSKLCKTVQTRRNIIVGLMNYGVKGLNYGHVAVANNVANSYVSSVAKKFCESGIEGIHTIARNPNSDISRLKLDGRAEGFLITIACTPPPSPYKRWTVDLCQAELNKMMQSMNLEGNFGRSTVWRALQRNKLQPHRSEYWCIPMITPKFILRMETVLHIYSLPYDPDYPVVCMDEAALQILSDLGLRLDMKQGETEKMDYEYERLGTKNIFLFIEPKTGRYYVRATESRTAIDWALEIKNLANNLYPNAKKIILITDNLNIHVIQSLYKAFPPEEARNLVERIHICYTPLHGSWLNIAEIGINTMKCQCIGKRFRTKSEASQLPERLNEWQEIRNDELKPINWTFTVDKAREKSHLYALAPATSTNCDEYSYLYDNNKVSTTEICFVNESIVNNPYDDQENIIDLCRSIDEKGNECWAVSLEENRVGLREPIGKSRIAKIIHKRNSADGWRIPLPSTPRKFDNEGNPTSEVQYDFDFMAFGEDIISTYNLTYNEREPVICIRLRSFDEANIDKNSWVCNFNTRTNSKQNIIDIEAQTDDKKIDESIENQEDSLLGFTLIYEPHTGHKDFKISKFSDDNNIPECLQDLVDNQYPEAEKIHLIICEDDSEKIPFLEQRFTPDQSLRIYLKYEIHVVPKNANWLNLAENEAIVVGRRCVNDRVTSVQELANHLNTWKKERTSIDLKLNLKAFRRAFSKVYKPIQK